MYGNEYNMTGRERGYKQPGKKLLCRDASEYQLGRTARERKRSIAAEIAATGSESMFDLYELRVGRARAKLSARRAAPVEALFAERIDGDAEWAEKVAKTLFGRRQWAYYEALDNDFCAKMAQDADDELLRIARG